MMMPSIQNAQNRQIHGDKADQRLPGHGGRRETGRRSVKEDAVSFWGVENVLKPTVAMVVQLGEYTKTLNCSP